MIKVSFKDDFKNVELLQKGIAPLKVNSFNGPTLYIMLTSQIGCEVEVTVVFQELRKQRTKLNKEEGELGHTLNKIDQDWTRKTALREVDLVKGNTEMENVWLKKMDSLKEERRKRI